MDWELGKGRNNTSLGDFASPEVVAQLRVHNEILFPLQLPSQPLWAQLEELARFRNRRISEVNTEIRTENLRHRNVRLWVGDDCFCKGHVQFLASVTSQGTRFLCQQVRMASYRGAGRRFYTMTTAWRAMIPVAAMALFLAWLKFTQ